MPTPLLDGTITFLAGEKKDLSVFVFDGSNPSVDLSTATATCAVYNSLGGVTVADGAATVTGTTVVTVTRIVDSTNIAPGAYRGVFTVTAGVRVQIFQVSMLVLPVPAAQTL